MRTGGISGRLGASISGAGERLSNGRGAIPIPIELVKEMGQCGNTSSDPIPRAEIEPRVFARATDNWPELAARFIVPIRTARSVKDDVTRWVLETLKKEGIDVASETHRRDPAHQ